MNHLLLLVFINLFVLGESQVNELQLFEMKKTTNESCVIVFYSFKTCDATTFIYEIGEQFVISFQRKICEFNNVFSLHFDSKDLGKYFKSKITINQRLDSEMNILLRFKLDPILSALYNCYYMVNNQIYLQIYIINATMNRDVENQNENNTFDRYSKWLYADHKTVLKKDIEYKEIDSDDIDDFFADCFYEPKNYFYGILACFGIGILYLIVLYFSRRFIYENN